MCGFLGVGDKSFYLRQNVAINNAFKWLEHRGPDETKSKFVGEFFIGFHRLAVVGVNNDESSQPIYLKKKAAEMMFNGEIFNYRKIAKEKLSDLNDNFKSDSQVLGELLDRNNFNFLNDLDGMFSIALIFPKENKVTLIRDRYGIKPLFYSVVEGNIIFSSHIKPILEIKKNTKENNDVIYEYLNTGLYDHSEQTFFEGVLSVPPGHIIEFDLLTKSLKKRRWYEIQNFLKIKDRKNKKELIEEVDFTIKEVINDYIPREVDFSVNVSGGVDSTLLVDNINQLSRNNFLLQNQDYIEPYSERPWIAKYSELLNVSPKYFLITPEFIIKDLFSTFEYQTQPFGGVTVPGYSPLYKYSKENNCKVVLDGTGLDEAFLGYPRYGNNIKNLENKFWKKSLEGSSGPLDKKGIRPNAISENLKRNISPIENFSYFLDKNKNLNSARNMSIQDLTTNKIPRTTRFADHASSRFSLELRSPFLSHRIIHLGFSINSNDLITEKGTKLVIRELLSKKGLKKIGNAPKRYIQSPQNQWIGKEFKPLIKKYLFSDNFLDRGWIKPEVVQEEYNNYLISKKENSFYIWQWLSLAIWSKLHL